MARIDIDDPYTAFLESQVKAGLFSSISEAARDAIRKQMEEHEKRRVTSIYAAIAKGEDSIQAGRTLPYSQNLMAEISKKGKQAALAEKSVKHEIRP
ncbi:MAG: type II toxin-antitoxin system ParD family antitoxin [Candidatus Scalindua sp.]|nr:type II toxin-antitoxin system ParD family antitoxin [Candidatus Scalindua sp.]